MNQSKVVAISRDYSMLINFAVILSLIVLAPLLSNQILTGTLVNSLLVVSVFLFGFSGAFLLVFIPSIISWFLGLLPLAMGPMIPFIFVGNLIFIGVIGIIKDKNYWLGFVAASAKAVFLFVSSYVLFNFFVGGNNAKIVASMMGYVQVLTASLGVVLAYGVLKILKRI
ncbi:MAG: iron hydrogenase [Candidatus Paceibacterota bacterium]|jgi:hypothetical protein|nr:iron hydrogenase [bacterium]